MQIYFKRRKEKYFLINRLIYLEYLCAHKHMEVHLFIAQETSLFVHIYFYQHTHRSSHLTNGIHVGLDLQLMG